MGSLPIEWEFDQDDLDLWVRLVDCSFLAASARNISSNTVLDAITNEIAAGHNHRALYSVLPVLLSGIDASAPEQSSAAQLPSLLLKLADGIFMSSYPPMDVGVKLMLFAAVENLTEVMKGVCKELTVELLIHIQDGVKLWIQDERDVFSDQEINEKVCTLPGIPNLSSLPLDFTFIHCLDGSPQSCFPMLPDPSCLDTSSYIGI